MQHFALRDELLDRTRNVLDRHIGVDPVLIEEVDMVSPQTLQASFRSLLDVLRSTIQTEVVTEVEAKLRGNLYLVAERFECSADDRLARIRSVHFRCIEECNALAMGLTDDLDGIVDRRCRAVI
jgi:hypothetical protein